jgi:hypothetical protein
LVPVRKFPLLVLLCSSVLFAQTSTFIPTTTLAAESGNNTSAPNSIATATSQHAASGNVSKQPIRELLYTGANTKVFAALMGWFGKSGHISVGYDSRQAAQVKKQVEDMQSREIDGAILAWYGKNSYENATGLELKRQAEAHPGFEFLIMIDQGTLRWDSLGLAPTDTLIAQLNYLADNYYSSPAYTKINGQPVVIEFALEMFTIDWTRVRTSIRGNPMIIFRNPNGWTRPLSDGAYSWEPEKSDLSYLDYFYSQSLKYPAQQTMGSLSPSFNDSLATWSANRYADGRCGQTWLDKAADVKKYYSTSKQLKLIQIATWNDYEEGSTVESGIDNCLGVTAAVNGSQLSWDLTGVGSESTVHHYTVFASQDGQSLMPVADLPIGTRTFDLSSANLPDANYSFFVKAVGKASLLNHISNAAFGTIGAVTPAAPADFAFSTSANAVTVTPGQPGSLDLHVTPRNGFAGDVTFSCTGLPATAQCSFTPATLAASGGATVSTTLLVKTTQTASLVAMTPTGLVSMLLLLAVLGGAVSPRRRRQMATCAVLVLAVGLSACGGGGAASPSSAPTSTTSQSSSTTTMVTVTATPSNPAQAPKTLQLAVTLK